MNNQCMYYEKRINKNFQPIYKRQKITLSLKRIKKLNHRINARYELDSAFYSAIDKFDNYEKLKLYLKKVLSELILKFNFRKSLINNNKLLNEIKEDEKTITLNELMEKVKIIKENQYQNKLKDLVNNGIDISNKRKVSSTSKQLEAVIKLLPEKYKNIKINKINYQIGLEMQKEFINRNLANKSVNLYMTQLKSMFTQAVKLEYVEKNPFSGINKLSESTTKINNKVIFTSNEIKEMIETNYFNENEKLMLQIALFSGMRGEELLSIRLKNINLEDKTFEIMNAKAIMKKVIPIHNNILEEIEKIKQNGNDEDYLLFPNKKQKARVITIQNIINTKLRKKFGAKKTMQKIRKTFRTYLENVDFAKRGFINELMGHTQESLGEDTYVVERSLDIKKKIINSIKYY